MSTMNISLPDALRAYVEGQAQSGGYASSSEYLRQLIREDQQRWALRALLLEGAASDPAAPADRALFDRLRDRVRS